MAGEEINGGINFRWQDNLSQAQASVVKFLAGLDKLNKVLDQVANRELDAAGAADALGGVSERTAEQLQMLSNGSKKLAEVQELLGVSSADVTAKISALAAGNMVLSAALKTAGVDVTRLALSETALGVAKERLIQLEAAVSAATSKKTTAVKADTVATEKAIMADAAVAKLMKDDEAAAYRLEKALKKLEAAKAKLAAIGGFQQTGSLGLRGDQEHASRDLTRVARATDKVKQRLLDLTEGTSGTQQTFKFSGAMIDPTIEMEKNVEKLERHLRSMEIVKARLIKQGKSTHLLENLGLTGNPNKAVEDLTKVEMALHKVRLAQAAGTLNKVEGTGFLNWLKNLDFSMDKVGKTAVSMTTRFVNGLLGAGRGVAMLTTSVAGLTALIAGAAIGGLGKYAAHFEQTMLQVNALVNGSAENLKHMTEEVKRLSMMSGISPTEMASGMGKAEAMVGPQDAPAFLEQATKLAVTQQMSLEKSLELLRALKKEYHLTTEQLTPMRDVLFEMGQRGVTEMESLASEIARMAPVAKSAGLGMNEMLAAVTTLIQVGHTPAEAVAILDQALRSITDPANEAKKAMKEFGLETTPAAIKAKSFTTIMEDLRDKLKDNPELIAAFATNVRNLAGFQELADHVDALKQNMDALAESTGKSEVAFTTLNEGPGQRLERLLASLKVGAIEVGSAVVAMAMKWISSSGGVHASQLRLLAIMKQIQLTVMIFVNIFMTAYRVVAVVVDTLVTALTGIVQVFAGIWLKIFSGLLSPVNLLIMGLKSLFILLQQGANALGIGGDEGFWNPIINGLETAENKLAEWQKSLGSTSTGLIQSGFKSDWSERMGQLWKDANTDAESIMNLGQEIADLRNQANDAEAAANNMAKALGNKEPSKVLQETRDQAEYLREKLLAATEDYVKKGIEGLRLWKENSSKVLSEQESGLRSLYTKQMSLARTAAAEMERLDEQRLMHQEALHEKLFALQQKLDENHPRRQQEGIRAEALFFEQAANQAAQAGNLKGVEKSVDRAVKFWEELLKLDPSRQRIQEVMGHLNRLGAGMDTVYGKERSAQQETANDATALAAETQNRLQELHKQRGIFERSFNELMDQYQHVGILTQAKLDALKKKVNEVQSQADLTIKINTSPAMKALDDLILKMKEVQNVDVGDSQPGQSWFTPPSTSPLAPNRTTNVDLGGVHINYNATPGSTGTDARRLATQINRHIQRGETAPLGGK